MPQENFTAIVFDTNFIVEHKHDLDVIHANLSKKYCLFVPDLAIFERLSQKYLEMQSAYQKIYKTSDDFEKYVTYTFKKSLEDSYSEEKKITYELYKKIFGDNIIP
ncbi:MAG: hypothetical protein EOM87_06775, partial [Clostridia bacterium]|nr:hypothetical protein [Clostridia bacterium]